MKTTKEFPKHLIEVLAEKLNCSFPMACIELQDRILKKRITGNKEMYQSIGNHLKKYYKQNPMY